MFDSLTPGMIAHAAVAFRLGDHSQENLVDYYRFARDMLNYDPMYGGDYAYTAHSLNSYGVAYDLIKDCLLGASCDTDYDLATRQKMNEWIRLKLARMVDHFTVNTKSANTWKYRYPVDFTAYMFHSIGVISHALADWAPPKGSQLTGPREWMDNAMEVMNRALNLDLYSKDGTILDGSMYLNVATSDVVSFAWIHQRMTGMNILKNSRFEEAVLNMVKTRFGDGTLPYEMALGSTYYPHTSLYQNDLLFNEPVARMVQWLMEEEQNIYSWKNIPPEQRNFKGAPASTWNIGSEPNANAASAIAPR